jgi:hypothetical protein
MTRDTTPITRTAPAWAWEVIDATLALDVQSSAFDQGLRAEISKAHTALRPVQAATITTGGNPATRIYTVIGQYPDQGRIFAEHYPATSAMAAMKQCSQTHQGADVLATIEGEHQVEAPEDYDVGWGEQ